MSRREDVDNAVWSDEDFVSLTPDAKLLYLWSFTNPACGMAGLYKAPRGLAAYQTGLTSGQVDTAAEALAAADFMYWEAGVVWVRSRVKHLRTTHANVYKSIAADVRKISPAHTLRAAFLKEYGAYGSLAEHLEGLTTESPVVEPNQENPGKGSMRVRENPQGKGKGIGTGVVVVEQQQRPTEEQPASEPASEVRAVLAEVAQRKGVGEPSAAAISRAVDDFPALDHLAVAKDLRFWALDGKGAQRQSMAVAATFRNFLKRADPPPKPVGGSRIADLSVYDRGVNHRRDAAA